MITTLLGYAQMFLYAIWKVQWLKVLRLNNKSSQNILWFWADFPAFTPRGYMRTLIYDLGLLQGFVESERDFCIKIGKNIGGFHNKNIFFNLSARVYNRYGFVDYVASLLHIIEQLERQGNKAFPNSFEVSWWENKDLMQERFLQLDIPHPRTLIAKGGEFLAGSIEDINFPILWKDAHSAGSVGIHRLDNADEYNELRSRKIAEGLDTYLLQELIDMRKDLRVTLVGDEIVLHYWRINKQDEWMSTTTSNNTTAEYDDFPEKWRGYIIEAFKKLNIRTGAFDITWQHDDVESTPLFLEISPSYKPNPRTPDDLAELPYKKYKKAMLRRHNYWTSYVNIVFEIKCKLVKYYLIELDGSNT